MKHLYLLFLSTFVVGFLSGFYLFFVGDKIIDPEREERVSEFEIIGEMYGGCDILGECPLYKIIASGAYTYVEPKRDSEDERYEDTLSGIRTRELETLLEGTDFNRIAESKFTGTCPAAFDGSAYLYKIRIEEQQFDINSCVEDISREELFIILENYFQLFSITHEGN